MLHSESTRGLLEEYPSEPSPSSREQPTLHSAGMEQKSYPFNVYKATLFSDRPRNSEPWSSDMDDTRAGTPSPNYPTTPMGGHFSFRQI
ncbi:hypothetical protein TNCV_4182641 [Trichonephila clavipes]|nr:hypothetical protein TNCV_4182641 [Trichonephila clavipes]